MRHVKEAPRVRICAYPVYWLVEDGSFETDKEITWSTGRSTKAGDIQVFAVSSTLAGAPDELANDPRRDAVHSIWEAITPPLPNYAIDLGEEEEWPVQTKFRLLVKLKNPVPKSDLIQAGLLKRSWPRHWQGKILHAESDIEKLGEILARKNPDQRRGVWDALNL